MRIGVIGLGAMGAGMARRLIDAGHALAVLAHRNRAPVERLLAQGAAEAPDAAALARSSDCVLLCLPDSDVVAQVVAAMTPGLRPGLIAIDAGTSSLAATEALAARMAALGVDFAEAPLAGGWQQAEAGALGAIVGCDEALYPRIEPILRCFCAAIQRFGPVGAGGRAKLINNAMVFGVVAVVLESFLAATRAGTDWARLYDVAIRGAGDSGVLRRMIGGAVDGDFRRYVFTVRGAHKDLRYIAEMNRALGLQTPLSRAVLDIFARAEAEGFGALLISELLSPETLAARGGV